MIDGSLQNLSQYIEVYFEQNYKDQTVSPKINVIRRIPIKWCTQDDFGSDK